MRNALHELHEAMTENNQSPMSIDYGYIHLGGNRMEFAGRIRSHQLALLDREYDDGFGGQELDGTIVFKDGTWLERGEYDGSEWWEYKCKPGRDRVLQTEIDKASIERYKLDIIEYTNHPTLSHLAETYQSMLDGLLEKQNV